MRVRRLTLVAGLVCAALVSAFAAVLTASPGAKAVPARRTPPVFEHVVLVVMENKEFAQVLGPGRAPALDGLLHRYALLTNYDGIAHPSLPNYIALVSGSTQGITTDCTSCTVSAPNLADTLERAGKTWKTYAEGLPYAGYTGPSSGRYAKKHNPFLYFDDVLSRPSRLRRIVPMAQFDRDLAVSQLPDFSLVVPNLCHDMHDCPVARGVAWLGSFLGPLLRSKALGRGVVFLVFDEGVSTAGGGGHVPALVLGPLVRPASRTGSALDHYDLLRTIEDAWGLPRLGRSATVKPIAGIWRRKP